MGGSPDEVGLTVGQTWSLELPGLGTAGYMWRELVAGPSGVVEVSWSRGFDPGAQPAAVGVSAPEVVTVRAVGQGVVTLTLFQSRHWEHDRPPINERRVTVRVSAA